MNGTAGYTGFPTSPTGLCLSQSTVRGFDFCEQVRLENVVHADRSLYLVFEHLDLDLKKHMDTNRHFGRDHQLVKVPPLPTLRVISS